MVIADMNGSIVLANAQSERLFGYTRRELFGQSIEMLMPERYRQIHPHHRQRYSVDPRARPMGAGGLELYGRRKDGAEFPAEISLSPLQTDEGLFAITAIRDMTERRKTEQERIRLAQAQEAVRIRDEFLSVAAHELRTPITALRLQLEYVQRLVHPLDARSEIRDEVLRKVNRAIKNTARLGGLVDSLFDVSRIASGTLSLSREDVNLLSLSQSVCDELMEKAGAAGCQLSAHGTKSAVGSWDRYRLEQILFNLISNAIKYGAGRPITVVVDADAEKARVVVRDQGIGVDEGDAERIFNRFERAVSTRHYGGLGLGLYIARHLAEAHGGCIRVISAPGAGAAFEVELPLAS